MPKTKTLLIVAIVLMIIVFIVRIWPHAQIDIPIR